MAGEVSILVEAYMAIYRDAPDGLSEAKIIPEVLDFLGNPTILADGLSEQGIRRILRMHDAEEIELNSSEKMWLEDLLGRIVERQKARQPQP